MAGGEVMSAPVHGGAGVDSLIGTVYHRAVMLAFEPVDVGIGWSGGASAAVSMPLVIDITRPGTDTTRGLGQAPQPSIRGAAVWPFDGARDVPLRLGSETPNPVPSRDVHSLGLPASITVAETASIAATSFVMTNSATGAVVPANVVAQANDPNLLVPRSFIALVPLIPLAPDTTYAVAFTGSSTEFLSGASAALVRNWSFTTGVR
jgi:hypothetical protein